MLQEEEIYKIVNENIDEACDKLVEKANALGGYDNISVIVVKKDEEGDNLYEFRK